jgi:hypothetical protein
MHILFIEEILLITKSTIQHIKEDYHEWIYGEDFKSQFNGENR